ncbi:Exodeoxyribonuclease VII large subunit [Belliella buryatensis]|uniref:Exodeoxyribonuclease 7 large subunit n=1 Tax=Belliella buryatensis TaxID=1500549 RepID=A0A239C7Y2_9BACT|nr:exodeoxyribonuclease VII large subunit [Belliella buryatensis]SNS16049.1 Exodeoxyribonuclease VII large subunit [Belliella buryatensis]
MQQAISLLELNQIIKDTLEQQLAPNYWVVAEIGELKMAAQGHAYLELVEKSGNQVRAKVRANIWQYSFRTIAGRFQTTTGQQLKAGMKILALATVTFHELYGLSLNIKDIDPNFTLGERARIRQEIIERLTHQGMMEINKRFELPIVPQKIAVISSQTAAGYGDFIQQLQTNRYGYSVHHRLFQATLQGEGAAKTIIYALDQIEEISQEYGFDLVVIIRGGGAQMDLDCFDDYDLAVAIAKFPIPIITGIGHERDETIADLVAHTKVKTPTAAAEFVLSGFLDFEEQLVSSIKQIERYTKQALQWEDRKLIELESKLKNLSRQQLLRTSEMLSVKISQIKSTGSNQLNFNSYQLEKLALNIKKESNSVINTQLKNVDNLERSINNLDPATYFKKGYTRSEVRGRPVHQQEIQIGDEMITYTHKQQIKSTINQISSHGE